MINTINRLSYGLKNAPVSFTSRNKKLNHTKTNGKNLLDSYLSELEQMQPKDAYNHLISITSSKSKSKIFISDLTKNPRDSKKYVSKLFDVLGSKENFEKWYFAPNGYMQAFHSYIQDFYNNATSIEELVKYMPSWGDWKLEQKARELFGSSHYTVGKLPNNFVNKDTFSQLVQKIRETYYTENRIEGDVKINGKTFSVKYPQNGLSGKIVAEIDDKYIIKTTDATFSRKYADILKALEESFPQRHQDIIKDLNGTFSKKYKADSPYLNMLVDYYLNSNNCINAAKFYYYDEASNAVLYRKEKMVPLKYRTLGENYFYSPDTIYNSFNDAKSLGIIFTDRGTTNYTAVNNKQISIDAGHAEYMDILKPGLTGYHITLPSNTGFSQMSYKGVLSDICRNKM